MEIHSAQLPIRMSDVGLACADRATVGLNPTPSLQAQLDQQFVAMLNAYRGSGGLARAEEIAAVCPCRYGSDALALRGLIARREVIGFEWQHQTWLPWFQFIGITMTPHPGLRQVLAELPPGCGPWTVAGWFAEPNALLGDHPPAEVFLADLQAVLRAACFDQRPAGALTQ